MDRKVAQGLIDLNKEFYQKLAAPFSASRGRLQPGVLRVLNRLPSNASILDLGCGNGGVAKELARRGHKGRYVGLDFSQELLRVAGSQAAGLDAKFLQADLTSAEWDREADIGKQKFDFVLAFAVLHHIPGQKLRVQILTAISRLLTQTAGGSEIPRRRGAARSGQARPYKGGTFIHSNWLFLSSPRLRARIQPWEQIGLTTEDVDLGDYLLDWRSGGRGLRYVHQFNEVELESLARESGFLVQDTFRSDGKQGDLSLYSVWKTM